MPKGFQSDDIELELVKNMDKKIDGQLCFPRNKKKIKGSKHSSTKQEKYFMYERETSVGSSCIAAEKERVRAEKRGET